MLHVSQQAQQFLTKSERRAANMSHELAHTAYDRAVAAYDRAVAAYDRVVERRHARQRQTLLVMVDL